VAPRRKTPPPHAPTTHAPPAAAPTGTLSQALAQKTREMLHERGWSQREFARRLGVTQGAVSYLLAEKRRAAVLDYYERLAGVFGVPLSHLVADLEHRVYGTPPKTEGAPDAAPSGTSTYHQPHHHATAHYPPRCRRSRGHSLRHPPGRPRSPHRRPRPSRQRAHRRPGPSRPRPARTPPRSGTPAQAPPTGAEEAGRPSTGEWTSSACGSCRW
jgi:transcriptional regulator with XRE-family HTH domain